MVAKALGNFIGTFLEYDDHVYVDAHEHIMRFRVKLDVRRALKREKKIKRPGENSFTCYFKYEKLPTFCYICGLIGHVERNCEVHFQKEEHEIERLWDERLRAPQLNKRPKAVSRFLVEEVNSEGRRTLADGHIGGVGRRLFGEASFKMAPCIRQLHANLGAGFADPMARLVDVNQVALEKEEELSVSLDKKRREGGKWGRKQRVEVRDRGDAGESHKETYYGKSSPKTLELGRPGKHQDLPIVMIILSWNCQGLGQPRAIQVVGELVKPYRPDVVILIETFVDRQRIELVRRSISFEGCFAVDNNGHSRGGLAVLWRENDVVDIKAYSSNYIDTELVDENQQRR
ncbi:hypothetical protein LINPERHAP1_LOCUS9160 [Linum perenne]